MPSFEEPLPPMWAESVDQRTGKTYYYHILTSERSDIRPVGNEYLRRGLTKPDKGNSSATSTTLGSSTSSSGLFLPQQPYAYYTHQYRQEKEKKSKRKNKKSKKDKRRSKYDNDDDDNDTYGVIIDSYSSDESSSSGNPPPTKQQMELFAPLSTTTDKSRSKPSRSKSSSSKDHTRQSISKSHRSYDDEDEDRRSKRKSRSGHSKSISPSRTHNKSSRHSYSKSSSPTRSKSRSKHTSRSRDYDDEEEERRKSPPGRSKSATAAISSSSKKHSDRRRSRSYDKNDPLEEEEDEEDWGPPTKIKSSKKEPPPRSKSSSSGKHASQVDKELMKQLEKQRKELEERKKALAKREKELEQERKKIAEERKREEEERQLKAALDEQERRETFEKEENRRMLLIRQETKRQVAAAEEAARETARQAEEARRKAEEQAEEARQLAAKQETARLKAEKEVELAKRKAALVEEARLQALAEAEQARQEIEAKIAQQDRALEKARQQHQEADEKRLEAERKALLEEQKRLKEELKRQQLEEDVERRTEAAAVAAVAEFQASMDISKLQSSDSDDESEEESDDDDESSDSSEEMEIPLRESDGHSASYSMDESIDLTDLVGPDETYTPQPTNKSTARERKRQLETKYASSVDSADTVKSNLSGFNSNDSTSSYSKIGNASGGILRGGKRPVLQSTPSGRGRSVTLQESPSRRATSLDASQLMQRQASARPGMAGQRGLSGLKRNNSFDPNASRSFDPNASRSFDPNASRVGRGMARGPSQRGVPRTHSVDALTRANSSRPGMARANTMAALKRSGSRPDFARTRSGSFDVDFSRYDDSGGMDLEKQDIPPPPKKKAGKKMEYEQPPKSLVLIWLVVVGELGFDLATTIIAFQNLMEKDECCGYPIELGPVPMTITTPFFLLVSAELALLIRAIVLTLFPNIMLAQEEDTKEADANRSCFVRWLCCCIRWKVHLIMRFLGILVLLNPFFGCLIAWILLYQSDKNDAFIVLGFEGGSLLLHYLSVYLEGGIKGCWDFFLQGLVPLVPFAVGVGLVLFYLKQGGVCYIVDDSMFSFNGCEVCEDGYPPDADGLCYFPNGTSYDFSGANIFSRDTFTSVDGLLGRTYQVTYCASVNPGGPETNFCFFDYGSGQLDSIISNSTQEPTTAAAPMLSRSKCGGTVMPGDRLLECRKNLWDPTRDPSMHCFTFGGAGDPCSLSIPNDGTNEGRFKDPSMCQLEQEDGKVLSYGDTFFLWDEPDAYGKDMRWAGNSWLAYSTSRWSDQLGVMRDAGVMVTTPLVKFEDSDQIRAQMQSFFDGCAPDCLDSNSTSYVDVLAVNVFCDPDEEVCENKVKDVTASLQGLSADFDSRPVYITNWGVQTTQVPSKLLEAMEATPFFFEPGSPVERVYWYGGDTSGSTNLAFQAAEGQSASLGDVWTTTCIDINGAA